MTFHTVLKEIQLSQNQRYMKDPTSFAKEFQSAAPPSISLPGETLTQHSVATPQKGGGQQEVARSGAN